LTAYILKEFGGSDTNFSSWRKPKGWGIGKERRWKELN